MKKKEVERSMPLMQRSVSKGADSRACNPRLTSRAI